MAAAAGAWTGTGIGAASPNSSAASPGVASSPGAGLTYTPSNVLGRARAAPAPGGAAAATYPGYSSFTPASIGAGASSNSTVQAPRCGAGDMGVPAAGDSDTWDLPVLQGVRTPERLRHVQPGD